MINADLTLSEIEQNQSLLRIYSNYRLLLATLLFGLFLLVTEDRILGYLSPQLHFITSSAYLVLAIITHIALAIVRFRANDNQLFFIFLTDIIAICFIIFASGKAGTGLSLLTVIAVAASAILFSNRLAVLTAALFSIGLLVINISHNYYYPGEALKSSDAGLFGLFLFLTVYAVNTYSQRLRESQRQLFLKQRDTRELRELNQLIAQRLRTGAIVLEDGLMRSVNTPAAKMLGLDVSQARDQMPPAQLRNLWQRWLQYQERELPTIPSVGGDAELQVEFARVSDASTDRVIAFIDNVDDARQKAQDLKLASLGQLTANIAHEIRNPLAAISHAAELLAESPNIDRDDQRLLEIIRNQGRRVNKIVNDVQHISKRNQPRLLQIDLNQFLQKYAAARNLVRGDEGKIKLIDAPNLEVTFDRSQLAQVLDNLCDNAERYSQADEEGYAIYMEAYYLKQADRACLSIRDNGPGINPEHLARLFEPFFTTEHNGTGLGLYISREICFANGAKLEYHRDTVNDKTGKRGFHLTFSGHSHIIESSS